MILKKKNKDAQNLEDEETDPQETEGDEPSEQDKE